MKKQDLRNFLALKQEIASIERILESGLWANTYRSPSFESTGATMSHDPQSPVERALDKKRAIEAEYQMKIEMLTDELKVISEWVSSIADPQIRAIINTHFICGYTWAQTSLLIFKQADGEISRNAFNYFCRNHDIN